MASSGRTRGGSPSSTPRPRALAPRTAAFAFLGASALRRDRPDPGALGDLALCGHAKMTNTASPTLRQLSHGCVVAAHDPNNPNDWGGGTGTSGSLGRCRRRWSTLRPASRSWCTLPFSNAKRMPRERVLLTRSGRNGGDHAGLDWCESMGASGRGRSPVQNRRMVTLRQIVRVLKPRFVHYSSEVRHASSRWRRG